MRSVEADCAQCFGLCCVALPFARSAGETAASRYAVLPVMRRLHEMLAHLRAALRLAPHESLRAGLATALAEVDSATAGTPDEVLAVDLAV